MDFEKHLLREDGSFRDINFDNPSWEGVNQLIKYLKDDYNQIVVTANDGNGTSIDLDILKIVTAAQNDSSINLLFKKASGLIKELQVYVVCETDQSPFVELSIYPADIHNRENITQDFIAWTDHLQVLLQSDRYYIRYENVSWKQGDINENSGVFLTSDHTTNTKEY